MLRDRGPLHNIGYGVTSRDLPFNEGETQGPSPDSGAISKALDNHPIARFVTHTVGSLAAAAVLTSVMRKGGLRLAQKIQTSADSGNTFSTSLVNSVVDIRKHLDELQGVKRSIDGVNDPYERLVYEAGDDLTTGYSGVNSEMHRYSFSKRELDQASRGIGSEPASIYTWKDEIQKRLIRAGRRLPYELPALYGTQKLLTDPLFGENENRKKVKWYNPVDVLTDFVKTSATNLLTVTLPFEGLGAGASATRNSLYTFKNSMGSLRDLSPARQVASKGLIDLSELLSEVGHDFSTIGNRFLKASAQTSGAFSTAVHAYKQDQPQFVQSLSDARKGAKLAREFSRANNESKIKRYGRMAQGYLFGQNSPDSTNPVYGAIDAIPAFRGLSSAFKEGYKEFKLLGKGYDALSSSLKMNEILAEQRFIGAGRSELERAMQKIQSQYSSRISKLAGTVSILGAGGPEDKSFTQSEFYRGQQQKAYKDLLAKNLTSRGIDAKEADNFVEQLRINVPGRGGDPTNIVSIGRSSILGKGDDYYSQLLQRYKTIKHGKSFEQSIVASAGGSSPESFLRSVIEESNAGFLSREFKASLNTKIKNQWNSFYRKDLADIASSILKPSKENIHDYVGPLSSAKQQFLQRKTAQVLGINLRQDDGRIVSDQIVRKRLAEKGFNPNNFNDLKDFLIEKRKMSLGLFGNGFSLFGLKPLLIDEAVQQGRFKSLPANQQKIISELAGRMAINDPVSKSIGFNKLDGVYQTKSGQILDFSSIRSTFTNTASFFASEFQIPIIKLNPADLFGYRSFSEMAKRGPLQYSPGRTVQPFGDMPGTKSDFNIWHSTGGMFGLKGRVTAFSTDNESGAIFGKTLAGTYRAVPTSSTEMLTKHARFSAGLDGEKIYDVAQDPNSRFLTRLFGNDVAGRSRALGFKRMMSIDAEQPNSIFGLLSRFQKRNSDINNPRVLAKLIRGEEVEYGFGSSAKRIKLSSEGGKLQLLDEAGASVPGIEEAQILRAYDDLRRSTFTYGLSDKAMRTMENLSEVSGINLFAFGGKRVSNISTPQQAMQFYEEVQAAIPILKSRAREAGVEERVIEQSFSRLRKMATEGNLLATSSLAQRSPTITTRLDQFKNELFRFVSQSNAIVEGKTDQLFIQMQEAILSLRKTLPPSQFAEAQAAALATLFNTNAFITYKKGVPLFQNAREAALSMLGMARGQDAVSDAVSTFFSPYTSGRVSIIGSNIRRPFSSLLPPFKKLFGTANYQLNELSTDVLGSGQRTTFVPTFGTVFGKDPMGAVKSAIGLSTYSDPANYSGASVPVSQGVERLNRYFGTLGMQLDVSSFKGPLDLYARGMVGKRVLPIYAAGTTFMAADRMLGGLVNPEDRYGENIYSPFFTTKAARAVVEAQSLAAGLVPGGMTAQEKREQLVEGEVPIRQGRFWPLGNTPFQGGKVQYYRPSWYRKLQGGAMFTSDTYGSPAEKFLFYNDISPLRPFDPYRFERKHYEDRPYPVTGEYFTGPFGPLTAVGNLTIGKILKPQRKMHEEEVSLGLSQYVSAGQFGAYDPSGYTGFNAGTGTASAGFGGGIGMYGPGAGGSVSSSMVSNQIGYSNANYAGASQFPINRASGITRGTIGALNQPLMAMSYGPPKQRGVMQPTIVQAGTPYNPANPTIQFGELGYRAQEMAGIYGFGFSSIRENLGFGKGDFEPDKTVLQSAAKAYGTSRAFWDLNLGGLGDVPIPAQGPLGNIEFSEIVRRFIPKERTGIDYINPIANLMGSQYPFLPGSEYYINFRTGDPFTKVQEGEIRLPGKGYERFNRLYGDSSGKYGIVNQLDILADVAPYSQQFKSVNRMVDKMALSPEEKVRVMEIRSQLEDTTSKYDFVPYEDQRTRMGGALGGMQRAGEYIAHRDTLFNTKFLNKRTATEDWERRNVYGATFPEWQRPFESFIEPMLNKATQRDPISAAAGLGLTGSFFGRTPRAKLLGSFLGATTGGGVSLMSQTKEMITGERFIPQQRKKELALEEYSDILTYVKNTRLAAMAQEAGDSGAANQFRQAAKRTMYGADLYGASVDTLSLAIPKRKREHFMEMINAPENERDRILSTAGRLERRIYQAAWGRDVEKRPDLVEYFSRHELPDLSWEGWHPNTNMDHVKIKIGQQMGLEMSQMGYYPQQIKQANLANPSYPTFGTGEDRQDTLYKLRALLAGAGINGTVTPVINTFGQNQISISAGVR